MISVKMKKVVQYSIVLAGAIGLYAAARQFEFTPRPGRISPDVWPKAILVLMMAACVFEIVRVLLFDKGEKEVEGLLETIEGEVAEKLPEEAPEEPQGTYTKLLVAGVALTAGYIFFMDVLGFFLDTLLYIILFVIVGRYRRPLVLLLSGLLGSLAFMFVFMKIVYLSLPIGQAPFSAVSLALMQAMGIR